MAYRTPSERARKAWSLAAAQHWVVALRQLVALGYTLRAIKHRITIGRLHPVHRGVYVVGRRDLARRGEWMAAVLACGEHAALSHDSAAALWKLRSEGACRIHVSVPRRADPRHPGIDVHRRTALPPEDLTRRDNISATTPVRTLIDLGTRVPGYVLEELLNEADKRDLIGPTELRTALENRKGQRGVRALREILERDDFVLTDSALERRFLPIARRAGLGRPLTQQWLNGFRVDFHWPNLGLVVETDGLRYHRTASEQRRDRVERTLRAAARVAANRRSGTPRRD